jgi:hypothetical protein
MKDLSLFKNYTISPSRSGKGWTISYINENGKRVSGSAAYNHLIKEMGGFFPAILKAINLGRMFESGKLSIQGFQNVVVKLLAANKR